ncbi:MAG: hypothetical protein QM736_00505 [Vicinamibacterales bacterium]
MLVTISDDTSVTRLVSPSSQTVRPTSRGETRRDLPIVDAPVKRGSVCGRYKGNEENVQCSMLNVQWSMTSPLALNSTFIIIHHSSFNIEH